MGFVDIHSTGRLLPGTDGRAAAAALRRIIPGATLQQLQRFAGGAPFTVVRLSSSPTAARR